MHELYTERVVLVYWFLELVKRSYGRQEEAKYPKDLAGCVFDAENMLRICNLEMQTPTLGVLRDCDVCVFSYSLNELCEYPMMTLEARKIRVERDALNARLCYWNGKKASVEPLVTYHRFSLEVASLMDLFAMPCN